MACADSVLVMSGPLDIFSHFDVGSSLAPGKVVPGIPRCCGEQSAYSLLFLAPNNMSLASTVLCMTLLNEMYISV